MKFSQRLDLIFQKDKIKKRKLEPGVAVWHPMPEKGMYDEMPPKDIYKNNKTTFPILPRKFMKEQNELYDLYRRRKDIRKYSTRIT